VIVQQPQPTVVVQQAQPQTIVVQQPQPQTVVVQQPAATTQVIQQQAPAPQPVQQAAPVQQTYTEPPAYPATTGQVQKDNPTNSYDVYIPADNGTFTLVQLKKSGSGYLGPQGEYYPSYPTMDQLKARYVK